MSALFHPITGFLPQAAIAHRMVTPPISMLSPDQRQVAQDDPLSFRHVVGRGSGTSTEEASAWFEACVAGGVLEPVGPAVLIYRLATEDHAATGIIGEVSVDAYDAGLVKKHEQTQQRTEARMAEFMGRSPVAGNPVSLAHASIPEVQEAIAKHSSGNAHLSFTAADGVTHTLWVVEGDEAVALCARFDDAVYITDGHHRMAAASVVARQTGEVGARIPAGIFAADELWIRAFARCVVDPAIEPDDVVQRLTADFNLEPLPGTKARPTRRHEFGCEIGGRAYLLRLAPAQTGDDLYDSLDVVMLHDQILEPMFGIKDPRGDSRLHYVADARVTQADINCDVSFLPYPATVQEVMAVADAGLTMPPKSTWFAPKLPSGLVIRPLP